MAHGHEQWCRACLKELGVLGEGGQRRKNQDNCNCIINKIFKKINKVTVFKKKEEQRQNHGYREHFARYEGGSWEWVKMRGD